MYVSRFFRFSMRALGAVVLLSLLASSPALRAQEPARTSAHLVSPDQLQQQVQATTAARQKNVENLTQFLSTPTAVRAMQSAKIDPAQVRTAIPTLSDAELADLSARATHAQQDFAAGTLDNNTLLIIILVLVAVILIAVIR